MHAQQDFPITYKMIHDLWALQKLSHDSARDLCIRARCANADKLMAFIDWTESRELSRMYKKRAVSLRQKHEDMLCTFKTTQPQLEWLRQYEPQTIESHLRFKALLLVGSTSSGKSRKACSIYGHTSTLVVNCQGLGSNLPSLRSFRRSDHRCIVFDEVCSAQVLANKLVFQAGTDELTLSQSVCNVAAYQVWLFGVPMILCSNHFQMKSQQGAPMAPEDEEYLAKNILDGSLPPGEKWFEEIDSHEPVDSGSDTHSEQSVSSGDDA